MLTLIKACEIQTKVKDDIENLSEQISIKNNIISYNIMKEGFGNVEFSAFLRQLNKIDNSFMN
jgi:hypothetical protein